MEVKTRVARNTMGRRTDGWTDGQKDRYTGRAIYKKSCFGRGFNFESGSFA
jgi:hypothetical protein